VLSQTGDVGDGVRYVRLVKRAGKQSLGDDPRPRRVHGHVLAAVRGPLSRHRSTVQPVVRLCVRRVHHGYQPVLGTVSGAVTVQQCAIGQTVHV